MTTNPDVLRIAREIVADAIAREESFPTCFETVRGFIIRGSMHTAEVQIAIAAIERTTTLHADQLDRSMAHASADIVRSYCALRQPEKDKSDAD